MRMFDVSHNWSAIRPRLQKKHVCDCGTCFKQPRIASEDARAGTILGAVLHQFGFEQVHVLLHNLGFMSVGASGLDARLHEELAHVQRQCQFQDDLIKASLGDKCLCNNMQAFDLDVWLRLGDGTIAYSIGRNAERQNWFGHYERLVRACGVARSQGMLVVYDHHAMSCWKSWGPRHEVTVGDDCCEVADGEKMLGCWQHAFVQRSEVQQRVMLPIAKRVA